MGEKDKIARAARAHIFSTAAWRGRGCWVEVRRIGQQGAAEGDYLFHKVKQFSKNLLDLRQLDQRW